MAHPLNRFVKIEPTDDGQYRVFLAVDHQFFCVTPHECADKNEATWFCDQLLIALERLVRSKESSNLTGGDAMGPER